MWVKSDFYYCDIIAREEEVEGVGGWEGGRGEEREEGGVVCIRVKERSDISCLDIYRRCVKLFDVKEVI